MFVFFAQLISFIFFKGRKNKSYFSDLERNIDEYWDVDSTDPDDEDSEEDIEVPIEGRL